MAHPRSELDREFLSPLRPPILAAPARVDEAEFAASRDAIEMNNAELSRQLTRLSNAGYLLIDKQRSGRYMKTWLSHTEEGSAALTAHITALRRITDR